MFHVLMQQCVSILLVGRALLPVYIGTGRSARPTLTVHCLAAVPNARVCHWLCQCYSRIVLPALAEQVARELQTLTEGSACGDDCAWTLATDSIENAANVLRNSRNSDQWLQVPRASKRVSEWLLGRFRRHFTHSLQSRPFIARWRTSAIAAPDRQRAKQPSGTLLRHRSRQR